MMDVEASKTHDLSADQSVDFNSLIESLRLAGAAQFDPVRLHYLQVLALRAVNQPAPVKRLLHAKLALALAGFQERFMRAQGETHDAVRQRISTLKKSAICGSLGDLNRYLASQSLSRVDARGDTAGLGREHPSTQFFRDTWSRLSVGKRVTQELSQAPKNAGPINSHNLVLRSLARMHKLSPDYLSRFTSYVDTLLFLDQCDKQKQVSTKKKAGSDGGKKTKIGGTKIP